MNKKYPNWEFETSAWNNGFKLVAGIDEAGRGPLAGTVVASIVILPPKIIINGINDSKKLSAKKREELFNIIQKEALSIGVGIIDEKIIDEINILQATYEAMKKAVDELENIKPDFLLIDGVELKNFHIKNRKIIRGDSLSVSIAAASIIAKVTRDRIMDDFDRIYPSYSFKEHKGYGTLKHREAIARHGVTAIHRKTFGGVKEHVIL